MRKTILLSVPYIYDRSPRAFPSCERPVLTNYAVHWGTAGRRIPLALQQRQTRFHCTYSTETSVGHTYVPLPHMTSHGNLGLAQIAMLVSRGCWVHVVITLITAAFLRETTRTHHPSTVCLLYSCDTSRYLLACIWYVCTSACCEKAKYGYYVRTYYKYVYLLYMAAQSILLCILYTYEYVGRSEGRQVCLHSYERVSEKGAAAYDLYPYINKQQQQQ